MQFNNSNIKFIIALKILSNIILIYLMIKIANNLEQFTNSTPDKLSCVLLIGYMNTGKSTFCELAKAYVAHQRDPDLLFDDGKVKSYQLPKVISNNSLKV